MKASSDCLTAYNSQVERQMWRYFRKQGIKTEYLPYLTLYIWVYNKIKISLHRVFHGIRLLRLED